MLFPIDPNILSLKFFLTGVPSIFTLFVLIEIRLFI